MVSWPDLREALRTLRNHALASSINGRPCSPEAIAVATETLRRADAPDPPRVDCEVLFDQLLHDIGIVPQHPPTHEERR